ncbi:oxygen-insensitive NAD(P)H nitroreductase [Centipeda periodontii DSM 2778]|uniref:Oxygen-insensitive NAD(P)H nitroreductase n=1 Tax=Centipeda periodontii DSM 2778 TaxID=888060 RepID=F5RLH9_9FIRM|nr:nitroreductase [Centipeda periodontii]EGK60102.1 oxygen-insensitive NAD(P)H nitroreductase [Centipeda periodontii DSM 2778]
MNSTIKDMIERRSIRKFRADEVPQALIDEVIEAGLYAASGKGKQSPIIVAVTNPDLRTQISRDNCRIGGWQEGHDPFYGAPVILMVLAPKVVPTAVEDGSLVLGNLMLAGHALGLGTIWINRAKEAFEEPYYKDLLKKIGIEGEYIGVGHCALGYRDGDLPKPPARRANRVYYVS